MGDHEIAVESMLMNEDILVVLLTAYIVITNVIVNGQ